MTDAEKAVIEVMHGKQWMLASEIIEAIHELSDFIGEYENLNIYRAMDNLAKRGSIASQKSQTKNYLRVFMLPDVAPRFGMSSRMGELNKYLAEVRACLNASTANSH